MNKAELIKAIGEKADIPNTEATKVLNAFLETVTETLQTGQSVVLVGFGTFLVKERAARMARNLQTGKPIKIPAKKAPLFKAGKTLKESVAAAKTKAKTKKQ
ncbi:MULTISPECIES: HU family DNA-binding protein [Entomomonas]|uniref:HU family DNA-binding protein n=1 Tax=Entomomonas asaccharolytica TaxID=2785331 RepID=A0A974RY23_9GAMM|nr:MULTISPECIES: HU family DNA-binding protein [Entomomonas]QQP86856.1 HU family DNA-binding protein [Entomomonas asaccharolytica]UYZ83526.1 HU family DNA-binding protein [Entomomonas sp. E2T0]